MDRFLIRISGYEVWGLHLECFELQITGNINWTLSWTFWCVGDFFSHSFWRRSTAAVPLRRIIVLQSPQMSLLTCFLRATKLFSLNQLLTAQGHGWSFEDSKRKSVNASFLAKNGSNNEFIQQYLVGRETLVPVMKLYEILI